MLSSIGQTRIRVHARLFTDLVGAVLDKHIDGFTARSLAPRSCYSISQKVHCSTREHFYYTQWTWSPSSMVIGRYIDRNERAWFSLYRSLFLTFVRTFAYSNNGRTFDILTWIFNDALAILRLRWNMNLSGSLTIY